MSFARRAGLAAALIILAVAGLVALLHGRLRASSVAHRPLLAWDFGHVALDAPSGPTNEQQDVVLLDDVLDRLHDVYYKPVDDQQLLAGEASGLQTYLKAHHVRAKLAVPDVPPAAAESQVDAEANQIFTTALHGYGRLADSQDLTYAAIDGALASLHDPYTVFLTPREKRQLTEFIQGGDFGGIGIYIGKDAKTNQVNVILPIAGTPAARAGLKQGDVILKVDGHPTRGLELDTVMNMIRGKAGTIVHMTIQRGRNIREYAIEREVIQVPSLTSRMMDGDIGYIQLYDFGEHSAQEVSDALDQLLHQGAKAFILDLRNNGGGLLDAAVDISSKFIPDGPIVSRIDRQGHVETDDADQDAIPPHPLVVLVNQYSASASEITAGAIQDAKVGVLIGTRTFGKGVVQTIYDLPGGCALKVTTQRYLTPNGRDINKKGIDPNIVVPMDYRNISDPAKDVQLKVAVQYLKHQLAMAQPAF